MTKESSGPNKGTAMLIDEATLFTYHPVRGRVNLQGEEITEPEMYIAFRVPIDRVASHMNALTRLYRKNKAVRLWAEFVENLELPLDDEKDHPRVTDQLGTFPKNGKDSAGAQDVLDQEQAAGDTPTPIKKRTPAHSRRGGD